MRPKSDVLNSINCYKFQLKSGTSNYECGQCDTSQSSTTPNLVNLDNGYKGCAQVQIPNINTYKASSTSDSSGKKIMIVSSCSGSQSTTAFVSVPYHTATLKD